LDLPWGPHGAKLSDLPRPGRRPLRPRETPSREVLDALADAIVITAPDGTIQFVNPMAIQMLGRSREALLGQPFGFPVAKGQVTELNLLRADGSTRVAEMRVAELPWGGLPAFLASLRDITERKRMQQEIQQLNAALERRVMEHTEELQAARELAASSDRVKFAFLAMSHALRTPLHGIIGYAEFLSAGKAGDLNPKQQEFVTDVLNSGQHLLQLIDNVLELSKIEAGQVVLAPENFQISRAVREVCSVIAPLALRKKIEFRQCVNPASDQVKLDLPKFKQVLYNLISNAVKFNREHGRVDITAEGASDRLRLRVADTGTGIKPDDLGKLFVEFQRLDSGVTQRLEGAGLGLALARRIVRLQGGDITVESEPGRGSTFLVEWPCATEA
jgi:signal transduction histidine kinase